MRITAPFAAVIAVGLSACTPPPYEQQQQSSVGFGNYVDYQKQREAQLTGQPALGTPGPVNGYDGTQGYGAPLAAGSALPGAAPADPNAPPTMSDLAAAGIAPATGIASGLAPVTAGSTATATSAEVPVLPDNAAISDEQDFKAVASRETIETDKARIAANRAQYQQIQPGALPPRPGAEVSPVIAYAIAAQNKLGQAVYKRSGLSLSSSEKTCLRYASTTAAQEAFLKAGGPKRDPKNLDPDGDGFACRFDPTPFQTGSR